ncbi:MAG TPA: Rnase Y domain-containing protein, partial [Ktedonobacteraceae bacterium]
MSPTIIVFALVAILAILAGGAGMALRAGYQYGREQNKARYEELLLAEKEASERKLMEIQTQQRDALHEARDETARFRATIERENAERRSELQRQERRMQQKE